MKYTHLTNKTISAAHIQSLKCHPLLNTIGQVADLLRVDTYIIGGFVRDLFLQRHSKDIDIVCVGDGIALANSVAQRLSPNLSITIFKSFGTAMLKWEDCTVEFASARYESYLHHSRNPIVFNGTLQDDQKRRDLTINTMAICLNHAHYGKLVDPLNGLQDLRHTILRTPSDPKQTFSDDPLRMLRVIRFAAQLDFSIAKESFDAIAHIRHRLSIVSQERVIEELHKIIATRKPSYGFKLLHASKLLDIIFPELARLDHQEKIGEHTHKNNFYHTLTVLDNIALQSSNIWLRWAAIFHDIAKPLTKQFDPVHGFTFHGHEILGAKMLPKIFKRMRLPLNKEILGYVQKLVKLHLRPIALVEQVTDSAIRRLLYEAGEDLEDLFTLCRADVTSKNERKAKQYLVNLNAVIEKILDVEKRDSIRNFKPIITGEIIMKTFHLKPCAKVGLIKNSIKNAILDGRIQNNYQEAFNYMLTLDPCNLSEE